MLSVSEFRQLVKNAPLVSIDLIIKDENGRILLGKRTEEPAMNTWFVPGGRIHKDKDISATFSDVFEREVKLQVDFADARFLGFYEHFYPTNFAGEQGFGTHYIVLAYELNINNIDTTSLPLKWHSKWKWFTTRELLANPEVHKYTKDFFRKPSDSDGKTLNYEQYPVIASRRQTVILCSGGRQP